MDNFEAIERLSSSSKKQKLDDLNKFDDHEIIEIKDEPSTQKGIEEADNQANSPYLMNNQNVKQDQSQAEIDEDVMRDESQSLSPKKSVGRDISMASIGQAHSQEDDILVSNEVLQQVNGINLNHHK